MKLNINHIKVALIAGAAFFVLLSTGVNLSAKRTQTVNSFQSPDFAFPQTVIKNAEKELASNPTDIETIQAMIQLTIAENMRDRNQATSLINRIDSIAEAKGGLTASILYSLEAQLVTAIYENTPFSSERVLPLSDPFPENIDEWSEDMFKTRILQLYKKSLEDEVLLKASPISDWDGILTGLSNEQKAYCPNLYVFLSLRALVALEPYGVINHEKIIPFFKIENLPQTPSESIQQYVESLSEELDLYAREIVSPLLLNEVMSLQNDEGLTNEQRVLRYLDAYDTFADFAESYCFLISANGPMCRYCEDTSWCEINRRYHNALNDYLKRYPNYRQSNAIRNALISLDNYSVRLFCSDTFRSDANVSVGVTGVPGGKKYFLKLFHLKGGEPDNLSFKEIISDRRYSDFISERELTGASTGCCTDTVYVDFGRRNYGNYAVVLTSYGGSDAKGLINDYQRLQFTVTDLGYFNQGDRESQESNGIYAVDNGNGRPLQGLTVYYEPNQTNAQAIRYTLKTDSIGYVASPLSEQDYFSNKFVIKNGTDSISSYVYRRPTFRDIDNNIKKVNIYTDRELYHKGDTVRFAVVAYEFGKDKSMVLENISLDIELKNASFIQIATVSLTTDKYGRAAGEFRLPEAGMNGSFSIIAKENDEPLGFQQITVADYVAPKFLVDLATSRRSYLLGDSVELKGSAITYTGMPLEDANVNITVTYGRFFNHLGSYYTQISTDSKGEFTLNLPTNLLGKEYERGLFTVHATVTAPSGETVGSNAVVFTLGNERQIDIEVPDFIELTGDIVSLKAVVRNMAEDEEQCELHYVLKDKTTGESVADGNFLSPTLELSTSIIPSGEYIWEVSLPGTEIRRSKEIVIYRLDDTRPPMEAILWVPSTIYNPVEKQRSVEVRVGTSYDDQYILQILSGKNGIIDRRWLNISGRNTDVNVPLIEEEEVLYLSFIAMRNGGVIQKTVTINTAEYREKLEPEIITFRDKISAGDRETWRIRYKLGDSIASFIPVMATMTDKSLNALIPFNWQKLSRLDYTCQVTLKGSGFGTNGADWYFSGKYLKAPKPVMFPTLNTYGRALYGFSFSRGTGVVLNAPRAYAAAEEIGELRAKKMVRKESESLDAVFDSNDYMESVVTEESVDDSQEPVSDQDFRETECPVAFFMPDLLTNEEGVSDIAFTAPNFNTTWVLQVLAYDPSNLKSNVKTMEVVASKKVMVQSQLPRFLRTSDQTVLAFTAFNNSGEDAEISLTAELLNPLTDEVITSKSFRPKKVGNSENIMETLSFTVPSNMESVKVKVMARLGSYSDGEQSLIGIIPSSTPVTESIPFFLSPDTTEYTLTYPEGEEGSSTMFSYCDNPIWYCVTALPDMTFPKNASILSTIRHLYGNSIALGLVNQYPKIEEAIRLWTETNDSSLVSPLQKEETMKIIDLQETPWTLNAQSESLRMSRLSSLLDTERCQSEIEESLRELKERQNSDGSWSWCNGMTPSRYITGRVLLYLSMLKQMDYLPDDPELDEMIQDAVKYCDNSLYLEYLRNKKQFSTTQMLNYLYVRSGFPDIPMTSGFAELKARSLKEIEKTWKDMSIYDSAVAAIVLKRHAKEREALLILESLRQKAMVNPERGMWYANLSSSWAGRNALLTTMQVLEAYSEVNPRAPQSDQLRQWLLIQRQVQDWGTADEMAEVIYAILSSGTDWTANYEPATFRINGKEITVDKREVLTGSFSIPLDNNGGVIEISKSSGHQAWGGVLTRKILPIREVKPYSESDIRIKKTLLRVIEDESGLRTEEIKEGDLLHLGDTIRVQMIINSERTMDYVCIIDGRSACLSPAQQLSGYVWQQGAGYYRDVQNDCTNLFYDYMPKGTTFAEYDCYVSQEGVYSLGIAQIQCLYAPLQTAHSGGATLTVKL